MPCSDQPTYYERTAIAQRELNKVNAMLCGVLTSAENLGILGTVLQNVNETECGVTIASIRSWFNRHKKEDARRKAREEATRKQEEVKREALAKLSPEERKALGLKD